MHNPSPLGVDSGAQAIALPTGTQTLPAPPAVLAEQLKLLCRQWIRAPIPVFLTSLYVGYLAWDHAERAAS